MFRMDLYPGEAVILDGGSTDGTAEIISEYAERYSHCIPLRLIVDGSCNRKVTSSPVAKARNITVRHAKGGIIASTDAGCILTQNWLERITAPLLADPSINVVGGWYLPDARSFFERCVAIVWLIPPEQVSVDDFIPSSRSFAFRKTAWALVGGYPETSLTGEDTAFVLNLRAAGQRMVYAEGALVYWRMKSSVTVFMKLVYGYGFGDGFNSILLRNVYRNLLKLGTAVVFIALGILSSRWFFVVLMIYWWLLPLNNRLKEIFKPSNIVRLPLYAFLKVISDATYIIGYIAGKRSTRQPVFHKLD